MYMRKYFFEDMLHYKIDSPDLKNLMEINRVMIIDVRSHDDFKKEHIAGAINIPLTNITDFLDIALFKETMPVVYCEGIGCNDAIKAAIKLSDLNCFVKILVGGIEWWKRYNFETIKSKKESD